MIRPSSVDTPGRASYRVVDGERASRERQTATGILQNLADSMDFLWELLPLLVFLLALALAVLAVVYAVFALIRLGRWLSHNARLGRFLQRHPYVHVLLLLLLLLAIVVLVCGVIGDWLMQSGVPPFVAYPLGFLAVLGLLMGIALAQKKNRDARADLASVCRDLIRLCAALVRLLWRDPERYDFRAARRASGNAGRIFQRESLTVWTDMDADLEAELDDAVAAAVEDFAHVSGFPPELPGPLRALCFRTEADFRAYTVGIAPDAGRFGGYYVGMARKRIVICGEMPRRLVYDLRGLLVHELTHHLLRGHTRLIPPPWLEEGLAGLLQHRLGRRLAAEGGRFRYFRAVRARGDLFSGSGLVKLDRSELYDCLKNWRNPEKAARARCFYAQSAAFCRYLHESNEANFRDFLAGGGRHYWSDEAVQECFGEPAETLMEKCLQGLHATELPPFEVPPAWLKQQMETELVQPLKDPRTSADDRRLAVRTLGALGYPWRADVLIGVLEGAADPSLRTEARYALEHIAGELVGTEPDAWIDWFGRLPGEVTATQGVVAGVPG